MWRSVDASKHQLKMINEESGQEVSAVDSSLATVSNFTDKNLSEKSTVCSALQATHELYWCQLFYGHMSV